MPLGYVDNVLNFEIDPTLQDVNGISVMPLLNRVQKRSKSTRQIKWNADLGGATAIGEPVTVDALNEQANTAVAPAKLPIGENRFRRTFGVLTTVMAEAAAAGENELANVLAFAGKNSMRTISRSLAAALYNGTGNAASAGIFGLNGITTPAVASKSTGSYAGISPATAGYERWTNYVNTSGTNRALTLDLLYKMSEEIYGGATIGSNQNYDAVYMSPGMCTRYKLFFQSISQTNVSPNGIVDAGFSGLYFEGRPVYMDPYCPPNRIYFVDESALALYSFVENENAFGDERPTNGIVYKFVQLARTNPDYVQFSVVAKNQLVLMNRPAVAVLDAIVQ